MTSSDPTQPPQPQSKQTNNRVDPIVFFDGLCVLCNSTVDWLLQRDLQARLRFSPLQGETAKQLLGPGSEPETEPTSIVLFYGNETHRHSTAIILIFLILGGKWALLARVISLIPRTARDLIYKYIAKNRFRWFGKRDHCRLPTSQERLRFLP